MTLSAALELPELPVEYRYPVPSAVLADAPGPRLRLATSGGPSANPRFFEGLLTRPVLATDLFLTLGDVARSRFHVPPRMLQRILELADPIATCGDDRLRFEAFSACASVYARVDLTPEAFDGVVLGRGTTNVDFGPELRAALGGIVAHDELRLAIGATEIEIRSARDSVVERRVPLPSRWLRSFLEVQAVGAALEPLAELDARATRAFLRSLPKSPSKHPVWIAPTASNMRLLHHDPGGAPRLDGLTRLRLLERTMRHATALRVHAGRDGSTGWQLQVPGGWLTLMLSPDVWRGFSGEGRGLHVLADEAAPGAVAAVRAALGWRSDADLMGLAATTDLSPEVVERALASLAISGIVGYDLADGHYFRRELPYDLGRVERLQPRLRGARRLVAQGLVRVESETAEGATAWVLGSGDVEHHVRASADGWHCTCPWYGRHRGQRGPCKHVLAVQIEVAERARDADDAR